VPLVAAELVSLGSSWWLTRWAAAPAAAQAAYLAGFAGWALASAALVVLRSRLMLGLGLVAGERAPAPTRRSDADTSRCRREHPIV